MPKFIFLWFLLIHGVESQDEFIMKLEILEQFSYLALNNF